MMCPQVEMAYSTAWSHGALHIGIDKANKTTVQILLKELFRRDAKKKPRPAPAKSLLEEQGTGRFVVGYLWQSLCVGSKINSPGIGAANILVKCEIAALTREIPVRHGYKLRPRVGIVWPSYDLHMTFVWPSGFVPHRYNYRSLGVPAIRRLAMSRGSKEGNNAFTKVIVTTGYFHF